MTTTSMNWRVKRDKKLQPVCLKNPPKSHFSPFKRFGPILLSVLLVIPLLFLQVPGGKDSSLVLSPIGGTSSESGCNLSYEKVTDLVQTTDGGFALAITTRFDTTLDWDILLVKTDMEGIVQWSKTYGQSGYDTVGALVQTVDGGYILAARTSQTDDDGADFDVLWLIKTDASGNVEWNKTFGPSAVTYHSFEDVASIVQTKDDGFVLALTGCRGPAGGYPECFLIKIDRYGTVDWSKPYNGPKDFENVFDLVQTEDSGFAFAGSAFSGDVFNYDMWLVKTDRNGVMEWNQTYDRSHAYDAAYSLIQTDDGGFALAGSTSSSNHYDVLLVKTERNGVKEWSQKYDRSETWPGDEAYSLIQTDDGGFALVGYTHSMATDSQDMWLVKTDRNGVVEWNRAYGDSKDDVAAAVIQTADRGFVIAGFTCTDADTDTWLMKTDESGNEEWKYFLGGIGDEEWATDLIQADDGGFVFTGYVGSRGDSKMDAYLAKTDGNGMMMWNWTYGGKEEEDAAAVIQTAEGGFVIAGSTSSRSAGKSDAWLVKTDRNGLIKWQRTYGGKEEDGAAAVIQTADGGFALAGFTCSRGAGNSDAWLVKTDGTGTEEWNRTYGGDKDDKALRIFQLANGSLVMLGYFGQHTEEGICDFCGCYHYDTFDHAWLLVTDEKGILHQNFIHERPGYVRFHDLVNSTDNSIAIAGLSASQLDPSQGWAEDIGQNSLFYLRIDETRVYQWNRTLTDEFQRYWWSHLNQWSLIHTTDGGFLFTCDNDNKKSLVKMDSNGVIQWNMNYTVKKINTGTVLIQTADGGYALAGGVLSHGAAGQSADAWLLRIDETGSLLWEQAYGTIGGLPSAPVSLTSESASGGQNITSVVIVLLLSTLVGFGLLYWLKKY
ncbi:MAG: hypothetical protein ACFFCQ_07035 [Promethearchaeota archaeon]